jgi:hypothetical protein
VVVVDRATHVEAADSRGGIDEHLDRRVGEPDDPQWERNRLRDGSRGV